MGKWLGRSLQKGTFQNLAVLLVQRAQFSFVETTLDTVIKVINSLNPSKACPADSIPSQMVVDNYDLFVRNSFLL